MEARGQGLGKQTAAAVAVVAFIAVVGAAVQAADLHGGVDAQNVAFPTESDSTIIGLTAPSRDALIGPIQPGLVAQIAVKEGQSVARRELLLQLDDRLQAARTASTQALAENELDIALAQARITQAQQEVDWLQNLGPNSSAKELNDAHSALKIAQLALQIAQFERDQARHDHRLDQLALENHRLLAPFDGYIASIDTEVGQAVDGRQGVIRIVQLDPLEVTLDCPLTLAPLVKTGIAVNVRPAAGEYAPRSGRITFVSRVADPASQTFPVRIEIPNAEQDWAAGLKVAVDLSPSDDTKVAGNNGEAGSATVGE